MRVRFNRRPHLFRILFLLTIALPLGVAVFNFYNKARSGIDENFFGPVSGRVYITRDIPATLLDQFGNPVQEEYYGIRAGDIQARAATLNQRYYALLPPVWTLEDTLDSVLPDNYRQWMTARNALLAHRTAAPRRHVERVQEILQPCGGVPGTVPSAG